MSKSPDTLNILNGFKDPALAKKLLRHIESLAAEIATPINLMEVCGTHTVCIAKSGIRQVMPKNIRLLSGPGCPVCVTANADIDRIIALTRLPDTVVATFGDMIRVPGSSSSLLERKAEGACVEVVYSPLDSLELARSMPSKQVVFVGVGFETTAPLISATIERAQREGLANWSVLTAHKRVPPALKALVDDPELQLDALILPGHVSTILGETPYRFLVEDYRLPCAIVGFELLDILHGIRSLLEQLCAGQCELVNAYSRAVNPQGNTAALAAIERVFATGDASWRGLGMIADSGQEIRPEFAAFDASRRFELQVEPTQEPKACRCGDVLRGIITPNACPLFGKACTPTNPVGPCMVSGEGSCAAYFRYRIED